MKREERNRDIKARVAVEALKEVHNGAVVGVGTGLTSNVFISELGSRVRVGELSVKVIPSSLQSRLLSIREGLTITSLEEHPQPDLFIDSFDEGDRAGNFIKGGGGALTREKILCTASQHVIFIAEEPKIKDLLSISIPLEVLPFSLGYVDLKIKALGGMLSLREGSGKAGPVISDNGNLICDADFGVISDPEGLEERLDKVKGIIEHGLFIRPADKVIIGMINGGIRIEEIKRRRV